MKTTKTSKYSKTYLQVTAVSRHIHDCFQTNIDRHYYLRRWDNLLIIYLLTIVTLRRVCVYIVTYSFVQVHVLFSSCAQVARSKKKIHG